MKISGTPTGNIDASFTTEQKRISGFGDLREAIDSLVKENIDYKKEKQTNEQKTLGEKPLGHLGHYVKTKYKKNKNRGRSRNRSKAQKLFSIKP